MSNKNIIKFRGCYPYPSAIQLVPIGAQRYLIREGHEDGASYPLIFGGIENDPSFF